MIWTGGVDERGAPQFSDGIRTRPVRCWWYEQRVGPIPPEKIFGPPTCGHSLCLAPEHELLWTRSEAQKGRKQGPNTVPGRNAVKTECDSGHPLDEKNTRLDRRKSGIVTRACRKCEADRKRTARATARAAGRVLP